MFRFNTKQGGQRGSPGLSSQRMSEAGNGGEQEAIDAAFSRRYQYLNYVWKDTHTHVPHIFVKTDRPKFQLGALQKLQELHHPLEGGGREKFLLRH